jgi:hypothetical protein
MTALSSALDTPRPDPRRAQRILSGTGIAWFLCAVTGQAIFAVYIAVFYGGSAIQGNLARWNDVLFNGLRPGDLVGNTLLMLHLPLALLITASGPLQLVPAIRRRLPAFHRWNGRFYVTVALLISSGAIALNLLRPNFGGWTNAALQCFNGAAIFTCALMALRTARARNFPSHRRWATRLFLMASGVWFLRVMMMAWAIPTGGAGLGDQLDGPAGRAAMLAQTVLPLAVYQLYLLAETSRTSLPKHAMSALLVVLTLIMAGGIAGASLVMWLPRITA